MSFSKIKTAVGERFRSVSRMRTLSCWIELIFASWLVGCLYLQFSFGEGYHKLSWGQQNDDNSLMKILIVGGICFVGITTINLIFRRHNWETYLLAGASVTMAFLTTMRYEGVNKLYLYFSLVVAMAILLHYIISNSKADVARLVAVLSVVVIYCSVINVLFGKYALYVYIVSDVLIIGLGIFLKVRGKTSFDGVRVGKYVSIGFVGFCGIVCGFFICTIGVLRYLTYATPNFDFGIFCNMFHNMKESFSPVTTCERDMFLSHFAVHISPVYYLILPFYYFFSSPITLQIAQGVIIASGIIPLYLLARRFNISYKITMMIAVAYAAYPVLATGCFYDLHENCFLVPLLLWVFWAFESDRNILLIVMTLLTLSVKEDASIFIMIFALYVIISRKKYKRGFLLLAMSVVYFLIAIYILNHFGNGIMSSRYSNFIYCSDDSLVGAIKTVIINPSYLFTQVMATKDNNTDKLFYLLKLFLPLALMPLITKKRSRYILLMPILLNLLTFYVYQYNIDFQYSFAITAFLFYASLMNIADLKSSTQHYVSTLSAISSVLLFTLLVYPTFSSYVSNYSNNREKFERQTEILSEIPDDASVICSTFFLPVLSERDEIYEVHYHDEKVHTDYVILDWRQGNRQSSETYKEKYIKEGYVVTEEYTDMILIMQPEKSVDAE